MPFAHHLVTNIAPIDSHPAQPALVSVNATAMQHSGSGEQLPQPIARTDAGGMIAAVAPWRASEFRRIERASHSDEADAGAVA